MKLAAFFLAAPVVLQLVAADPQPTPRPNQARRALERWEFERQLPTGGGSSANPPGGNSQTEKETSTPTPTSTPTSTSTPAPTPTPTSTRDEESSTSRTTADQQSTTPTQEQSSPTPSSTSQAQSQNTPTQSSQSRTTAPVNLSTPSPSPSQLVTTNEQGSVITSVVLVTKPASAVGPSSTSNDSESKPISKGTIIGLGVTGGIAVLIVVLLIVWKLTNKRFSDLEDTGDDAIKWPELNKDSAAMTPLPARPTGRSGVETSALDDFDSQSAAHSTADLTGTHYQPYSDDPGYGARPQYYDPYGGAAAAARPYASPPGSHDGDHKNWGGPADGQGYADPHQQYYDAPVRGPSPGPNMAYGDSLARGQSPGPNMAYADPTGRTGSPAPGYNAYQGGYADQSMGGRRSPGPNLAYGGNDHGVVDAYGRQSPAPGMGYGGRAASPGPNAAYGQGGYR